MWEQEKITKQQGKIGKDRILSPSSTALLQEKMSVEQS
jgi:hypothetical protein